MPDYTFTIKTPAELSGVEQAVAKFERLRGQAKANGQEFEVLDQKIAAAKASIDAYRASLATTAQPTAKVADESERYAAALDKMQHASHEARAEEVQRQIDLRNTTNISVTGAAATEDATGKLAEAQIKATKASDEHEVSARKVDKAFSALAAAGGPLGRTANLLRELAGSPLTLGLALGSVAVSAIVERFVKWREEIAATKAQLEQIEWSKFSSAVAGIKNAYIELNNFNTALRNAGKPDDTTKDLFDERLAVIDAEIEKKKSLLKLNEELEISNARARHPVDVTKEEIKSAEKEIRNRYQNKGRTLSHAEASMMHDELDGVEKQLRDKKKAELEAVEKQIRSRYASTLAGLETDADRKTLQELQAELALREGKAPSLQQRAKELKQAKLNGESSPVAAEASAQIELLGGKEGVVEKLRAKYQAAQKAADSWSWKDLLSGDDIPKRQERANNLRAEMESKAAELEQWRSLQTTWESSQNDLRQSSDDALGEFTQNATAITGLKRQISKRQKVDPIKESQRANESMFGQQGNPASDQFLLAVAGAHNLRSGERASPDQAKAINDVAKVHGFSGDNLNHLLKVLDGLFLHQEKLSDAIQKYELRLERLNSDANSRMRDSFNQ